MAIQLDAPLADSIKASPKSFKKPTGFKKNTVIRSEVRKVDNRKKATSPQSSIANRVKFPVKPNQNFSTQTGSKHRNFKNQPFKAGAKKPFGKGFNSNQAKNSPKREAKQKKITVEELDAEMDAYMNRTSQ